MFKYKLLILFILLYKISISQYTFRVQCSDSKDIELLDILYTIPELTNYTLPNGRKIYFSGGYFTDYNSAKIRLEEVKKIGFYKAEIRVFRNNQFIPSENNNRVLSEAISYSKNKLQLDSLDKILYTQRKNKIDNNIKNIDEKSTPNNSIKNSYVLNPNLILLNKNKVDEINKKITNELGSIVVNIKDSSDLVNFVDESPIFKIEILKTKKDVSIIDSVNELTETIYQYSTQYHIVLAVGYFDDVTSPTKLLNSYIKKGYTDAKIIGIFKGIVISKELAEDLSKIFKIKNTG